MVWYGATPVLHPPWCHLCPPSQFPNAGLALDLTLLDWLERWVPPPQAALHLARYTFPTEAGLACPEKARQVYRSVGSPIPMMAGPVMSMGLPIASSQGP